MICDMTELDDAVDLWVNRHGGLFRFSSAHLQTSLRTDSTKCSRGRIGTMNVSNIIIRSRKIDKGFSVKYRLDMFQKRGNQVQIWRTNDEQLVPQGMQQIKAYNGGKAGIWGEISRERMVVWIDHLILLR